MRSVAPLAAAVALSLWAWVPWPAHGDPSALPEPADAEAAPAAGGAAAPTAEAALELRSTAAAASVPEAGDQATTGPATSDGTVSDREVDAVDTARQAARTRFLRLLDEGRHAEAAAAGEELVALTQTQFGADSIRLAAPLTNLGTARLRAGDLRGAEASYKAAVELIDDREGILAPRLVNPLLGLGETYTRAGQYGDAGIAYERALRVNQVNEGLYNLEQIRIRDGLSESYLGLRELDKANFHQEAQVNVTTRRLGSGAETLAPALYKLARWYDRSAQPERARFVYQKAARLIEAEKGKAAPELVEPLLAMGDTYKAQALLPPDPNSSESPLGLLPLSSAMYRRALAILDRQDPPDQALRARTFVSLGDLYMLWNRRTTAEQAYGNAWQSLADEPALAELRDSYFRTPVQLMATDPPRLFPRSTANRPPADGSKLLPGIVLVGYAVEPSGRATEVRLLESDPPGLIDDAVVASVRNALYRPRYADGKPVRAEAQVHRHEFRYQENRLKPTPVVIPEGGRIEPPAPAPLPEPPGAG